MIPIASRGDVPRVSARDRTREVILNAALRVYGRDGYAGVTMRAIAKEIGCSAGSLYRYFLDKTAIVSELQGQGLRLYAEAIAGVTADDPAEALRRFFLKYYEFSKQHPDYFNLLWVERSVPALSPSQPDLHKAIVAGERLAKKCIDEGTFPPMLSGLAITRILWSAVHGPAVLGQLPNGAPEQEADALVEAALDLVIAGLREGVLVSKKSGIA